MEHKHLSSFQAAKNIISCSFQLLLGFWCVDIMMSINLHYLAKFTDKITTSAFGISQLIVSMAIVPICYGTNQTLNQQSSQAMGQNKTKLSLIYLNFTIYIHILTYIPFCIIIYLCKTPFSYLIKEAREETIDQAWYRNMRFINYRNMIIPIMISCFIVAIFDAFKNYLISCGVFNPFLPTHILTLLIHLFLCSQLVETIGYMGVCLSLVISEICSLFIILCYIQKSKMRYIFEMADFKFVGLKLKNMFKAYIYQAWPLVIHIYCDFIIFFTLSLFAFQLGTNETNAQLFLSNSSTIFFKITISISIALITFIGNELSQGNVANVRTYMKSSQGLTIIILLTIVLIYFTFRYTISNFFTSDKDVEQIFINTLPYFLLGNIIFDGFQTSLTGILKGLNQSSIVSNSTLTIYYVVGIPLLFILTFPLNLNLIGIWLSFGICNYILTLFYIYQISVVDLEQISKEIQNKLSEEHGQLHPKEKIKLPDIIEMDELDNDLDKSLFIKA